MSTVEDSTLPLRDTSLLGQYQFSTFEKTMKRKREGGNEKEYGERKKAAPRTKKGKGEWHKKAEEADVPNKKKKVEGPKKETLTDKQFDHVPLIHLKTLIPKIPKKGLANRVPRKRWVEFLELQNIQSTTENLLQQVAPGEILVVANDLMVYDDVEVGMEVNFNVISSEYGGDLLETMVVAEVVKTDIVFFNHEEVVGEAYQTLEVKKTEDEASQASAGQTTVVSVEEQTIEVAETEVVISHQKEYIGEASQVIDVYIKALIQYFDTQHRFCPDNKRIVLVDIFTCQYIDRAFNVWTHNMYSPEGVELKKKSIWEQITSM
ncbi:hypothetical protein GIB67_033119 [Kingdonia uniflora]|uniref:Uncharacterized protein n=1 Tax=Kingdonia uniflora TaxID=39325 RepID=A0A7J7MYN4_9MAGN|nr:hypothetical protein GIB67_033119 [Kingdonia uniflora]